MKKFLWFGLLLFLCPFVVQAEEAEKIMKCEYRINDALAKKVPYGEVTVSFTVYSDKSASFLGLENCEVDKKDKTFCYTKMGNLISIDKKTVIQKFGQEAYNKSLKQFQCPNLQFRPTSSDGSNFAIDFGLGDADDNYIALDVKQTNYKNDGSVATKEIVCSYNDISVKSWDQKLSFDIYYTGKDPNGKHIYSFDFKYGEKKISVQSITPGTNRFIQLPGHTQTLFINYENALEQFNDFQPGKAYNCKGKNLYVNNYTEKDNSYKIESTRPDDDIYSSSEAKPDFDPEQSSGPVQEIVTATCNNLLGTKTLNYLKKALTIIQIAGVVLAIILGMGDFVGALMSGEADSNKKTFKKFMVRIAMAAVLLIVPGLLKFVLDTFGISENGMCML